MSQVFKNMLKNIFLDKYHLKLTIYNFYAMLKNRSKHIFLDISAILSLLFLIFYECLKIGPNIYF